MGLNIIALRKAVRQEIDTEDDEAMDDAYDQGLVNAWVNESFVDRADGFTDGFYASDETMGFRAGPYCSYNRWREWLSETMLGQAPEKVWDSAALLTSGTPFVELVRFSDNEGIIGPRTSAKLAKDFEVNKLAAHKTGETYFIEIYENFREAFEMASDDGLVQFH